MATTTASDTGRYVGEGVLRKEDPKLITGQATFIESIVPPGTLWLSIVRSTMAHARLKSVNVAHALEADGVVAAFTGPDLSDEWTAPLPLAWPVTDDIKIADHWAVAKDKVCHQGDAVAVILAESRAAADDAAELVEVEYEPLPLVTEVEAALADDAPIVHESFGTNKCYTWSLNNGDIDAAFKDAEVVVKERYVQQRLIANAIEPRGVVVLPIPASGEFTLWSSTQIPHILKVTLAMVMGIPEAKLRVIAPDVGGGFGSKLDVYAEEAICLALARRLGRPIKWVERRSEGYLSTVHGRDQVQYIELAATADGKIKGIRARLVVNMGAYLQLLTPGTPLLGAFLYCGSYGAEAYSFECTGVYTNTTPTDAYRGAGRPEATYAIERAIDALARKVGIDPVEIRRRNFLPKGEDVASPGGLQCDSIDFEATLDKALAMLDYPEFRKTQQARRDSGDHRQLGVGFSSYVEMCGLAPSKVLASLNYVAGGWDAATVRVLPTGKVEVAMGVTPHGQGHETSWSQITADALGVDFDDVVVLHSDTQVAPLGMDTYGSRSLSVGGVALHFACERVIAKAKKLAAHTLEVATDDLEFSEGKFSVKGVPDKAQTIQEVAFGAWSAHDLPDGIEPGLSESYVYDPPNFSFPFGTHICIVEVDTETGKCEITRYIAVDDCGNIINPMIVDGQIHGGIAQGAAQALYEEAVFDSAGNLLTSSMMNYLVPSAAEFPSFELGRNVTPNPTNPMGVKGIGEAGTIAATPAVVNAVIDALSHLGVEHLDMPASPETVWKTIQAAQGGAS